MTQNGVPGVPPDGNCLFNAILQQIHHDKEKYTPDHLRRQTALHMLKHADMFYEYVAHELIDFDESYKSYVINIFNGKIWGDDLMVSAIVHIFNIPISIVSPEMRTVDLFHNVMTQIVIIANGGSSVSRKPTTHFSQTCSIIRGFQLSGAGALKDPQIWDGFEEGHKKSFGHFLHHEKEATLTKMHTVRQNVDILHKKIHHLYKEAEKVKSCKKVVEYQLESIQQDISNIKLLEMAELTRGIETTATETSTMETSTSVTLTTENPHTTVAIDEEEGMETEPVVEEVVEEKVDESREEIIVIQLDEDENITNVQKELPRSVQRFIPEKLHKYFASTKHSSQPSKPLYFGQGVEGDLHAQQTVMQSSIQQSIAHTIHDVQSHQPIYVQSQISSQFQQPSTTLITHHYASAPITFTQSQAPLIQQDPQQLIVTQQIPQNQPTQAQVTGQGAIAKKLKSRQVSESIPAEQRDPKRYYCKRCPHNYSTKADLKKHHASYLSGTYQYFCQHTDMFTYYCTKCGAWFYHQTNYNPHIKSCQGKVCEEEDDVQLYFL